MLKHYVGDCHKFSKNSYFLKNYSPTFNTVKGTNKYVGNSNEHNDLWKFEQKDEIWKTVVANLLCIKKC